MKSIRLATAAAVVTGLFAASSEAAVTEWWSFNFNDVADIVALTNDNQAAWTTTGVWTTEDTDESAIIAAGDEKYQNESTALKLDTQGTELQWTLKDAARPEGTKTLIDADMYLVGAEDDPKDFDNGDVQAAIYLRSVGDEEITNNLCVYTYDGSPDVRANVWVPLKGTQVENDTWHHVQVIVDYSGSIGSVSVFVDNMQMEDEDGNTSWTIANADKISPTKISSVSFKGTGAVDNFVGAVEAGSTVSYLFTGATLLDGAAFADVPDYSGPQAASTVGTPAEFTSNTVLFDDNTGDVAATLATVSIVTFDATGVATTTSYTFEYDEGLGDVVAPQDAPAGLFDVDGGGLITVMAPTANATAGEGVTQIQIVTFNYASVGGGEELAPVDPGSGFADYFAGDPDSAPLPVEVVDDPVDGPGFTVRFIGQAGVTYQLIAVDDLDDDWSLASEVGDPETPATAGVVELVAPMTEDAQFYKIKATK